MSLDILYEKEGEIVGIFFDVTRTTDHDLSVTPTQRAVGAGAPFSDHVQRNPIDLGGEVAISNYPLLPPPGFEARTVGEEIGPFTGFRLVEGAKVNAAGDVTEPRFEQRRSGETVQVTRIGDGGPLTRVADVFAELRRLMDEVVELTITTSVETYDRMILARIALSETLEANGGAGLIIPALGFQSIRIATSEVIESPVPLETRAERNRRRGRNAARERGEDEGPNDSVLSQWLGGGSTTGAG